MGVAPRSGVTRVMPSPDRVSVVFTDASGWLAVPSVRVPAYAWVPITNEPSGRTPRSAGQLGPVPAADSLVDEHRRHLDVAASWGVPAYVSVLYPYVTADPGTRMPRPRSRPASRSSIASFTASSG